VKPAAPRTRPALAHLEGELAALADAGLLRVRPEPYRASEVSFCSNDYLGLGTPEDGRPAMGSGAARLVAGEHVEHRALEVALATWLGHSAALLFTSGYAANVGLVPALARDATDLVLSDALNHASLVDGCRLARAETRIYPHLDLAAVEEELRSGRARRTWVVTESYFSMDADSPDLAELRALCDHYGAALVVDEAHALGVLGPEGRGLLAAADVQADVTVGTLGKAFGGAGAFVAGCDDLVAWLWNRARSFVFSTGLSPALAAAGLASLERIRADGTLRSNALARADQLRVGLRGLGKEPLGYGHIVPWRIGDSREASRIASALRAQGFGVQAIRPPSVPAGTARIRFTASARQRPEDIDKLLLAIGKL
jgi:8-amino-7-oxononanoate synthase